MLRRNCEFYKYLDTQRACYFEGHSEACMMSQGREGFVRLGHSKTTVLSAVQYISVKLC